jgi:hypothetical protein
VLPLKTIYFVVELYVGDVDVVALLLFPDLSLHPVTDDDESVKDDLSAASSHTRHPGIDVGVNPEYGCVDFSTIDIV